MKNPRNDRPLGKILHVINGEAITQPKDPFIGRGSRVVLEDLTEIGILGDPFGNTSQPFQPVKLHKIVDQEKIEEIIGKRVFAQIKKKKKRNRRRNRSR